MRYEECPTVEVDIVISAPAEAVWAHVSDIGLPARFSTELQGVEWVDEGGPGVGARFVGHNRHPAIGSWDTTCTVTAYEPHRAFSWVVGEVDHPSSAWRFSLVEEGDGTRLTQWMQMGPARSGINLAIDAMPEKEDRILRRRLDEHRRNMEGNLRGIKELVEG